MSRKSKETSQTIINRNKNIISALEQKLNAIRKNKGIEDIAEFVGALIIANSREFNNEAINTTIADMIKEAKEIVEYPDVFLEILVQYVQGMEVKRNGIISKKEDEEIREEIEDTIIMFYANGLVDYDELQQEGLYLYVNDLKVLKAIENGKIDKKRAVEYMTKGASREEGAKFIVEIYEENLKNPQTRRFADKFLRLLEPEDIFRLFLDGDIGEKELRKVIFTREDILNLDPGMLTEILKRKNVPIASEIKSEQLLDLYMKKFSGKQLVELAENGRVDEEKIITLVANNAVEEFDEEKAIKPEEVLEFYNGKRLLKLLEAGKINARFVELLNEKVLAKIPEEEVKKYYAKLISDIREGVNQTGKDSELEITKKCFELYQKGILPSKTLSENIEDFDTNIFSVLVEQEKEEVVNATMAKLFNEDAISLEALNEIFTAEEIMDMYNKKMLSPRALLAIPEEERELYLELNRDDGNNETKTILDLYTLYDGISIDDVSELLRDRVAPEEIYRSLDREKLSRDKVRELFTNYLISQDELGKLRDEGIITAEDYDCFSSELDKAKFYESLRRQHIINATGVETDEPKKSRSGVRTGLPMDPDKPEPTRKDKITSETRKLVLETLGGETDTATILGHHKSFDGYSIVGFEPYGLVVFENFNAPSNATYIMTYQQAEYFLKNTNIADAVFDDRMDYTGTKAELRNTENVRRRLHSKHWAKNVAQDLSELSLEAKKAIKPNGKYLEDIKQVIEASRQEYERNK